MIQQIVDAFDRFFNSRKIQRRVLLPLVLATVTLVGLSLNGAFAGTNQMPTPFGEWHHVSPNNTCVEPLKYEDFYEVHTIKSDVFTVLVIIGTRDDVTFTKDINVEFDPGITNCFARTNLGSLANEIEFQARQACELRKRCKTEIATVDVDAFLTTIGAGRPLR